MRELPPLKKREILCFRFCHSNETVCPDLLLSDFLLIIIFTFRSQETQAPFLSTSKFFLLNGIVGLFQ